MEFFSYDRFDASDNRNKVELQILDSAFLYILCIHLKLSNLSSLVNKHLIRAIIQFCLTRDSRRSHNCAKSVFLLAANEFIVIVL